LTKHRVKLEPIEDFYLKHRVYHANGMFLRFKSMMMEEWRCYYGHLS